MMYKFVLVSDEADDFMREISIESEAKFIDLNNAILDSVDYTKDNITSFFICNDDWEKEQEITLMEMDTASDIDSYVMDDTVLSELIGEEGQKLLFVYDIISDRAFFMQLKDIVTGKDLDAPVCTKSEGKAPEQTKMEDFGSLKTGTAADSGMDENFYGDEDFDADELDEDSFSDLNFDDELNDLR